MDINVMKNKIKKVISNSRRNTYFVQRKNSNINTYIAGPTNGAHRATRLTLLVGKTRLDLNGNQIRALRGVLDKSKALAGVRTRKAVKAAKPAKPSKPATKPVKNK
jgi:hypothetical protein